MLSSCTPSTLTLQAVEREGEAPAGPYTHLVGLQGGSRGGSPFQPGILPDAATKAQDDDGLYSTWDRRGSCVMAKSWITLFQARRADDAAGTKRWCGLNRLRSMNR